MDIGRLLRTFRELHPLHVIARPHAMIARRLLRDVPSSHAPRLVERWPAAPDELRAHANAERARAAERIPRLRAGSALRAYEDVYGLEIGADGEAPLNDWSSDVAIAPFPASVRARRLAVGSRLGRAIPANELARAARAIALQPELHLLGNHLLENGFGLACAGAAAQGAEADAWWHLGCAILRWQLPRQFLADGGHFERSASYHVALTAALLETIEISEAAGRSAPVEWRAHASRAVGWALDVRAPDGAYPLFNDAALDAAPTIDAVVALARACDVAIDSRAIASADGPTIERIEPTGWVRMTAGDAWLMLDAGLDGAHDQPGHAHADGLTFELWVSGQRLVVDYGVASYEADDARRVTRATQSHNTVEVDGRDSCEVWGAFRVGIRGHGEVLRAERDDEHAIAVVTHDGYARLPGAPRHRRTIALHRGHLVLHDRVDGGHASFVSRLRLDARAARNRGVRVFAGERECAPRNDVWFARHGEARDAFVYETAGSTGESCIMRMEW